MNKKAALLAGLALLIYACTPSHPTNSVLVLTPSSGYPFGSTEAGIQALEQLQDFDMVMTSDPAYIHEDSLSRFNAVLFLHTGGDVLDFEQRAHFERFIQAGGGFVGIHAAARGGIQWPWYSALIGATPDGYLEGDATSQPAEVAILDATHAATSHLAADWTPSDRWIKLAGFSDATTPLIALEGASDESQPISWYQEYDGGRVFYTGLGFSDDVFADEAFLQHLAGGIAYAVGDNAPLDYTRTTTPPIMSDSRFTKNVLANNLYEPTEMEILDGGKVLFAQRRGGLMLYDPATDEVREVARMDVHTEFEDGLMGLALDPNYDENNWIYLYYSPVGDEPKQHLSRFVFENETLDKASESVLLEVAVQRDECCHAGGSIEFGPDGLLYLSTGDNVNPFASDGFGPIDERPGREPWDAQGSSGNTNDLRGKILRIRPEADGTYSIPDGNLFPEGTPDTRPEIYVMGNRNPYRIAIDQKTGYLYWGEVGPDARDNLPDRGPRGHDEINQARAAGNFGWPFFVGDNKAYNDYNFTTATSGPRFDPMSPVNDSPNNTGMRTLPPTQKAFIWYPYAVSPEFPIVGAGGRNAMAGPVFYSDMFTRGAHTFPESLNGRLFIFDWIRDWILIVTMDENSDLLRIDPFMASTEFNNPIDMQFDDEGVLYVLEYGETWYARNPDARISRIEYNGGNLPPVVTMRADNQAGAVPLNVTFSAAGTFDHERDGLTYTWYLDGDDSVDATGIDVTHTYDIAGAYEPRLVVRDSEGNMTEQTLEVMVGNEPPAVELALSGNQSFFWDGRRLDYEVTVSDREDGSLADGEIRDEEVFVQIDYLPQGYDKILVAEGHQVANETSRFMSGKRLIEESDCSSCHQVERTSIGPSYVLVAERYKDDANAEAYLADKIKNGGGGVWGEQAMAAHPQLTDEELSAMVQYIMSLGEEEEENDGGNLGVKGQLTTAAHLEERRQEGMYFVRALYTDRGANGIGPLASQSLMVLRHPRLQAESYDMANNVGTPRDGALYDLYDGSYIGFNDIDLTGVTSIAFNAMPAHDQSSGATIDIRLGTPDGPTIGTATLDAATLQQDTPVEAAITPQAGPQPIYFVLTQTTPTIHPLLALDWVEFAVSD